MDIKILKLIEKDAKMSIDDIAAAAGVSVDEAAAKIAEMESAGITYWFFYQYAKRNTK